LIAAYNNVLPSNNPKAIDDLCTEIEAEDTIEDSVESFKRHRLYPSSNFDLEDKNAVVYSRAEAAYLRMLQLGRERNLPFAGDAKDDINKTIRRIDLIENEELEKAFLLQKEKFRSSNIPVDEQLFFHGTHPEKIPDILRENFDLKSHPLHRDKRAQYGRGN